MLLEVIQPWPTLSPAFTPFSCTFPGFLVDVDPMDTLLVPIKIVDRSETFSIPSAIMHIAFVWLFVFEQVLSFQDI